MIDKLLHILTEIDSSNSQDIQNALNYSKEVGLIKATESAKLPFHINVISSAAIGRLKETAHSMILTDLLHKDKIRDLFLAYFFNDKIDPKNFTEIYRPDTKHIDVSLRGKDFFLIVENKVNNADEQKGQIYRYVEIANKVYKYNYSQIIVLYLNSDNYEPPSEWSLTKEGKGVDNILADGKLPLENLIVKSYKHDIIGWLKNARDSIDNRDAELYIDSALCQYIDYLENKFEISNRYDNMNNKINKLLFQQLELTQDNHQKSLETVEDAIKNVEQLETYLYELKYSFLKSLLVECQQSLNRESKLVDSDTLSIDFRYNNKLLSVQLCIEDKNKLWWVIRDDSGKSSKKIISYFEELAAKEGLVVEPNCECREYNPIWNYTSPKNAVQRYNTLINILEKEELL